MRTLLIPIFVSSLAGAAEAQVLGYVVAGPAVTSEGASTHTTLHAGAGVEVVTADRVGVGGELGLFYLFVAPSAHAALYLRPAGRGKTTPFVTGGYSALWRVDGESAFRAFNVGAGVHVWLAGHAGLRVELRDHLRRDHRGTTQYWSMRAGVVFR
jgi:hypothetical protein